MYSAYKLNKQGDNIQPWCIPFPICNQSVVVVPCLVLTVASWSAYRFCRRQVRWSGIPISLRMLHNFFVIYTVKGFNVVNEAEVAAFLDFPCFFLWFNGCCQFDLWLLCFSKSSLLIWNFSVHVLLKPGLENFEHYFSSMWNKCNCVAVWTFFGTTFLLIGMKIDLFQSCGHCWVFQTRWHVDFRTLTALSFRMWINSAGIHHLH